MRSWRDAALPVLLLLSLAAMIPAAYAFDNGDTTSVSLNSSLNQQVLTSTLSQLSGGESNPQFAALLSQFNTSLSTGNATSIQYSLANLKSYQANSGGFNGTQLGTLLSKLDTALASGNKTSAQGSLSRRQQFQSQLAPGASKARLGRLLSQINSSVASGNSTSIQSTLGALKAFQGAGGGNPALGSLLNSLTGGPNGVSVNPSVLSSLLGLDHLNSQGVPSRLVGMDPSQALQSLGLLANLMNGVNPSFGANIANILSGMTGPGGVNGLNPGALGSLHLPSFSTPFGGSPPSLGSGSAENGTALPSVGLGQFLIPAAVVGAAVAAFLLRKRLSHLLRGQLLPGPKAVPDVPDAEYDPRDPRKRVMFSFSRVVRAMAGKGVVRDRAETHREFSSRCAVKPEAPQVTTVSGLYERAKFSKYDITDGDATTAESAAAEVELLPPRY